MHSVRSAILGGPIACHELLFKLCMEVIGAIRHRYYGFVSESELDQACAEMKDAIHSRNADVMRMLLLIAMYRDHELVPTIDTMVDKAFIHDMCTRVVPACIQSFVDDMCQDPRNFVVTCVTLHVMWAGEQLTNTVPLIVCPMVQMANADAPPPAGSTAV